MTRSLAILLAAFVSFCAMILCILQPMTITWVILLAVIFSLVDAVERQRQRLASQWRKRPAPQAPTPFVPTLGPYPVARALVSAFLHADKATSSLQKTHHD